MTGKRSRGRRTTGSGCGSGTGSGAAQIVRGEPSADVRADGIMVVRSLATVEAMLPA
jgi:hypothetical protein